MLTAAIRGVDLYGLRDAYMHRPKGSTGLLGVDLYGVDLYGLGATADPAVKDLQTALTAYAKAGHPEADPGGIDGIVGPKTRMAVVTVVGELPKVPSEVKLAIQAGAAIASASDSATEAIDGAITSYAQQIAAAVRAVMVVSGSGTSTGTQPGIHVTNPVGDLMWHPSTTTSAGSKIISIIDPSSVTSAPGKAAGAVTGLFEIPPGKTWTQTWWGKGAIGAGVVAVGVAVWKLVL